MSPYLHRRWKMAAIFIRGFLRRWNPTPSPNPTPPPHLPPPPPSTYYSGRVWKSYICQTTLKIKQTRVKGEFGRLNFLLRTQKTSRHISTGLQPVHVEWKWNIVVRISGQKRGERNDLYLTVGFINCIRHYRFEYVSSDCRTADVKVQLGVLKIGPREHLIYGELKSASTLKMEAIFCSET